MAVSSAIDAVESLRVVIVIETVESVKTVVTTRTAIEFLYIVMAQSLAIIQCPLHHSPLGVEEDISFATGVESGSGSLILKKKQESFVGTQLVTFRFQMPRPLGFSMF